MNEKEQQILIHKTDDGQIKLRVKIEGETVWFTQDQMAELFEKSKSTINEHIRNVYEENELSNKETMRKFGNSEFSTKPTNYYNLDVIISVDEFLKLSERQLLKHAGKISAEQARERAQREFENYKKDRDKNYISDFDREVKKLLKQEE